MGKAANAKAALFLATCAMGLGPADARTGPDRAVEAAFDAQVSSSDQLEWLKDMSSQPNHVGSLHDRANAEGTLAKFRAWGWSAEIETFDVLYPTPISTLVELVEPTRLKLGGQEPAVPGDSTSGNTAGALPPYVAFQGDGDVTAPVVYVNYGMPEDYDALERRGINVRGKIAIARYGAGWRGLKAKLAQEHGAVGCIIYSDPAGDGFAVGDVYPKGGARPPQGVQRGSVMDMMTYPGDPLTPGVGAIKGTKRLDRAQAVTILKIPVLPMSYGDAVKLLAAMDGPIAPASFRGGLPITYHLGGGQGVRVHLAVKSDWSLKTIYDVIARIEGSTYPDQWIIRGNHHDGWVFGAADPLSGNVAMLSEAKALGALLKTGWRPRRTIVYASWDAEEPMILGSTEWAETHAAELKAKAIIYINSDSNGRGLLGVEGSHEWQHFVNEVAADVIDPETKVSVADRVRAKTLADAFDATGHADEMLLKASETGADIPIGALGSGSDFSAFLDHLGLPVLNLGYGGEDEISGVYHSLYDSYDHVVKFDDPGLVYGATLSKTVGRMVLRIADADTPPQRFSDFAATVAGYLDEVRKLIDDRRAQDVKRDVLLAQGAFRLATDPQTPVGPPLVHPPTPFIELAELANAVETLKKSATAYDTAYSARGATLTPEARRRLNALLQTIDQLLLTDRGLPLRPWYKHLIYAPGLFTGYGAKTLPGVREAIEERRFKDAEIYAKLTADALLAYAARLDAAGDILAQH